MSVIVLKIFDEEYKVDFNGKDLITGPDKKQIDRIQTRLDIIDYLYLSSLGDPTSFYAKQLEEMMHCEIIFVETPRPQKPGEVF